MYMIFGQPTALPFGELLTNIADPKREVSSKLSLRSMTVNYPHFFAKDALNESFVFFILCIDRDIFQ